MVILRVGREHAHCECRFAGGVREEGDDELTVVPYLVVFLVGEGNGVEIGYFGAQAGGQGGGGEGREGFIAVEPGVEVSGCRGG